MAHHKPTLAVKICESCQRPFSWRKKWWRCWHEVKYCSERCRRAPKSNKQANLCAASQVEDEF
jgi:hypothetical protein